MVSDSVLNTAIGQLPAFIAAVTAAIIGWLNHRKGSQIHQLVNSANEKLQSKVDAANIRIEALEKLITNLTARRRNEDRYEPKI